ncbi:eCIS core domain-containing protein [Agriterribacter sp.]|uniref:eCIS core domain-containing protein n=1 Tax=Agriterribacter sp. TaxID=2821509 RepID=UPI002BDBE070|nr:DUF4157 domain-containing protein [Agriterribacter sp.]HTN06764.1 DUF4157 domain-containing protein [Agriterribacter sp.]
MKTAEPKTATVASNAKANQPFFSKEGNGSFFGEGKEASAFFKPSSLYSVNGKGVLQTKPAPPAGQLTIGQPNDTYEKEADAMADKIMHGTGTKSEKTVQAKPLAASISPLLQTKCAHCEEEEKLQRKERNGNEATAGSSLENYVDGLSGGRSLPNEVRRFYEPHFGCDFSNVKVHTDTVAAKSAQSINALAYTSGNNIVFNSGQYSPATDSGKRLLGHELTHVVQQGKGIAPKIQRMGDLSKVPPMACDVANTSSAGSVALTSLFPTSSTSLSAAQRNDIALFAASWQASGGTDTLRVDGYASTPGADEMNWRLSCERALSVSNELRNNGVPDNMIEIFAQGETNEFGAQANNQRADITMIAAPPVPVITSETVVTSPGSRARTTVGVGEEVNLTHSSGNLTTAWAATAGTLSANVGATVLFTAPDTAQTVTVTADTATINFTIIAPNDVHMDNVGGSVKHHLNLPDSGILADVFLLPDNVNFNKVTYRELDVVGIATSGAYACNTFKGGHCSPAGLGPCGDKSLTSTVIAGKGTKSVLGDCAYSGHCGGLPPFAPGIIGLFIPYEYKTGTGSFRRFATVFQVHSLAADASTLTTRKAGANGSTTVTAPTALIGVCP